MKRAAITESGEIASRGSFFQTMVIYLIVCGISTAIMITSINQLIKQHDKQLTGQICGLVAEKINNSINYMTVSALDMSAMLTAQEHDDLQALYDEFKDLEGDGYVSMGLIDSGGRIYATETEIEEFKKWELMDIARVAAPVSISAPYRSGLTGEPVFTLFSKMTYGKNKDGLLFLTYPLKEIQKIATTETLSDETEIWLMNAESDNLIQCAGGNKYEIGSWANAILTFERQINTSDRPQYLEWKRDMVNNLPSEGVSYYIDDTCYSQVYSDISFMHGWYVVVRMPSSAMSTTMEQFRGIIVIFASFLFVATMILSLVTHRRDLADRAMLENLSIHDPLTDVMNRRAFDMAVENQFSRMLKPECGLLFIDVDYFKRVNDSFGHDAGDQVLVRFAEILKDMFGDNGLISRYGGDEFLVFVRDTNREELAEKAAQLNERVHAIRLSSPQHEEYYMSCSIGGAFTPDDANSFDELKSCADAALYVVKERGRDGCGWYEKGMKH